MTNGERDGERWDSGKWEVHVVKGSRRKSSLSRWSGTSRFGNVVREVIVKGWEGGTNTHIRVSEQKIDPRIRVWLQISVGFM